MLPIRHSSIFRSRWIALLWAAGIIWTAIDLSSPDTPDGVADNAVGNAAIAALPADQQEAMNALAGWGR